MARSILTPPDPGPAAIAELKQWLGITTTLDDAPLGALLLAALDACEQFTGLMPLIANCEEVLPVTTCWQTLATRPVLGITGAEGIPAEGARFALAAGAFEIDLGTDGSGRVRTMSPGAAGRIAVRFSAGLAADWSGLAAGLRHGIIRLAAHQHRTREDGSAAPLPPAAVAALWRPWRRMSLA